ncbi:A disintegrin and metalloproteinase with thrombospondin motifs 3-like [Antedon mediterranea]|uniref:A disintegrin and metalloproteinase with thrombospondin motifs 3-like n=1 Tax=Antedon mediterranea TaxID=105859 RepID=UPI003AF862C9
MIGRIRGLRVCLIFLLSNVFYQDVAARWTPTENKGTEFTHARPYHSSGKHLFAVDKNEFQYYTIETDDGIMVMNVTRDLQKTTDSVFSNVGDGENRINILPECIFTGSIVDDPDSKVVIHHCGGALNGWVCGKDYDFHVHGSDADERHTLYKVDKSSRLPEDLTALVPRSVCTIHRQARNRRSVATNQKFVIELAILADYSVHTFYGDETKDYLLKVMMIATESFRHSTFKYHLDIVINKIIYLDKYNSSIMIDESSPTRSRRTVGQFMYMLNNLDDNNPDHFDAAVYITRNNFGPKGFAKNGGMCNLQENTVLVRDEGYKCAYVIAHEIGHLLDMEHDGEGNSCRKETSQKSIMSSDVSSTFNMHTWSKCSNERFESFATSPAGWCLKDEPFNDKVFHLPNELYPGIGISMDKQCSYQYGSGFVRCNTYFSDAALCDELWCMNEKTPYSCAHKRSPPLDGTPCGKNKMCNDRKCIKTPNILKPTMVDGGWNDWSDFSECSLSCGVGISTRERKCTNPEPKNGGKYCTGSNFEHKTCNVQKCPEEKTDVRADLCKEQNSVLVPAEAEKESERCLLTCVSKTSTSGRVVSIGSVPDGTPCSYDEPTSICIQGACMRLGCDNVLGSTAQFDSCGVCHGTNETCTTTKKTFRKNMKKKSYAITSIPVGARSIHIFDKTQSGHSLVLRNVDTGENVIDTRSIEWQTTTSRYVISAGVKFTFSIKEGGLRRVTSSPGPILNKMSLKIYRNKTDSKVPSVVCKFVTEKEKDAMFLAARRATVKNIPKLLSYIWVKYGVSECSATCGGGFQMEIYKCKKTDSMKIVNERKCQTNAPVLRIPCAENACKTYSWDVSNWSDCSKPCGEGERKRTVKCVRVTNGKSKGMKPKLCMAISDRPNTTEKCSNRPFKNSVKLREHTM